MEVEAVDEGVLGKILVGDGTQGVKVNAPIAVLVEAGEKVPEGTPAPPKQEPPPQEAPARREPEEQPAPRREPPTPPPVQAAQRGNGHDTAEGRLFVSPLARRMAQQAGIELGGLKGSGPNGRIVKVDIEAALQGGRAAPAAPAPAPAGAAARTNAPLSPRRIVWFPTARCAR